MFLFLKGHGPEPHEHWVSRICEEFGCLPSEAERERERTPAGLLDRVIEARRFAEMVRIYEADPKRALGTRLGQLVMEIDAELVQADTHG